MALYRRNYLPGGTFFFTVTLRDRRSTLLTDHIDALRKAMHDTAHDRPYRTDAIVILPEHLHAVWTLPEGDTDYPGRWRAIKARFTRNLLAGGLPLRKATNREYRLWQHRYWEHTVRNPGDLRRHVDYIHFNPVKHGHVSRVADWPFSSFHRLVARGELPMDWGGTVPEFPHGGLGEPT